MHLIALVTVALAASASALPRIAFGRDLGNKARQDSGPQTSLTLDSRVICTNFEQDGSANATSGQEQSLTSTNNFINFCLTAGINLPLTNGQQFQGGSCNPTPMGVLAPSTNMPSAKFVKPKNLDAIKAHTTFEISMAIRHLEAGHFTNPDSNFYAAPQRLNAGDDILGHPHFVIESLSSVTSTDPSDPSTFAFFKGVDTAADSNGNVSVNVTGGLPAGVYKLSSINTSANHAPVLVAIAQHGTLDDQVYIFVTKNGKRPKKFV
jgi:hypothetical protein